MHTQSNPSQLRNNTITKYNSTKVTMKRKGKRNSVSWLTQATMESHIGKLIRRPNVFESLRKNTRIHA